MFAPVTNGFLLLGKERLRLEVALEVQVQPPSGRAQLFLSPQILCPEVLGKVSPECPETEGPDKGLGLDVPVPTGGRRFPKYGSESIVRALHAKSKP